MKLTSETAIRLADLYLERTNSLSNFHYIVVGFDETKGEYYTHDHVLCPNELASDEIKLKEGELLVKAFNKKLNKKSEILRNDNFICR